jgi:WD40 repeat protein/serine/threonine protein kinase
MNHPPDLLRGDNAGSHQISSRSAVALDDPRVIRAVEEYLAALEAGPKLDRQQFLARYPEIAEALAKCLDGLEFVHGVAPELSQACRGQLASSAAAIQPEGPLGDFRIVREIGRGGMGVVYEAVQISLGRRVALKVLPFAAALDAKQLQRFKNEAQAAAHLHHTNIVPVFGVGCERGVHYYAMQFIEGQTLAKVIADLRLQSADLPRNADSHDEQPANPATHDCQPVPPVAQSAICNLQSAIGLATTPPVAALSTERSIKSRAFLRTVANLGVQAAAALEHAHQLGVVHRDIKPANLLVDARGNLWVTDFGLAQCQGQAGLTLTGDFVGTFRYMSPEQASAKRGVVDHRTDIYSLGVTLYELLTLEPAYAGRDRVELLQQITGEEPRLPRHLNPGVPAELETIVLKALAKNPEERYATAQEVADDLQRFLDDKPIRAKRSTMVQKIKKWARRKPAVAGLVVLSAVAILLFAVVVGGFMLLRETKEQQQIAEQAREAEAQQRQIAEDAREAEARQRVKAERFQYFHHITFAGASWQDNQMGRLEELLNECAAGYRNNWEWHFLNRQCHADLLTIQGHEAGLFGLAFSPDGRRLATGSIDKTIGIWDARSGQQEQVLRGHDWAVNCVAFSPDGRWIASASGDGTAKVWDAKTGECLQTLKGHGGRVACVAFHPDCRRIATVGQHATVRVWDWRSAREERALAGHNKLVKTVAFSPDGKRLASAGEDASVKVWDVTTDQEPLTFEGHHGLIWSVAFSPDGTRIASASNDQLVKIWDLSTSREVLNLKGHSSGVVSVAFSPDGRRIASGSGDRTVKVWNAATGQVEGTLRGHANIVFNVAFSPDGARLASSSQDRTVKFWDATPGPEAFTLAGDGAPVFGVAFSPNGRRIASASQGGRVRVWDVTTGRQEQVLSGHGSAANCLAFSPDGQWLASGGADKSVQLWDATTWQRIRSFPSHAGELRSVAFSPDSQRLAAGDAGGALWVWEAATGQEILHLNVHDWEVRAVAFSPDGAWLVSSGADRIVKLWDAATGQPLRDLPGHHCWVHSVAFSPDLSRYASGEGQSESATQLASASGAGEVILWDAATGQKVKEMRGHGNFVKGLAFSPEGTRLASGGEDEIVKLWDVTTGAEVLTLRGHAGRVVSVAFSPDGKRLASAGLDGRIEVWDARPLTPDIPLEREAVGLLNHLFAKPLCRADVIDYLQTSPTLRPQARDKALALLNLYQDESGPKAYHQASWTVVRQPYLNEFQYRFALRQAETAYRLAHGPGKYQTALGAAQYRAGKYPDALATLEEADRLQPGTPAGLAFLAMTQYQLEQKEQARAALARLRQAVQEPHRAKDGEAQGFLHEAESLIQGLAVSTN